MEDQQANAAQTPPDAGGKGAVSARAKRRHRDLRRGRVVTIPLPDGGEVTLERQPSRGKDGVVVTVVAGPRD